MEYVSGVKKKDDVNINENLDKELYNQPIKIKGIVHTIRDMSEFSFIVIRKNQGVIQTVLNKEVFDVKEIHEGTTLELTGTAKPEDRAPNGFEVTIEKVNILSQPAAQMPIPVGKWKMKTSLETKLALRPVSLRNIRERAVFKIQEGVVKGFRDFLYNEGFTEIRTPKIVAGNAEGGANVFKLDYFGKKAFLAQSPQFYKQMLVPVYERVFEVAPVFRAEKHNTTRHLNEYTSMDFEMGFIEGFEDIMDMETGVIQYIMNLLKTDYAKELKILVLKFDLMYRIFIRNLMVFYKKTLFLIW